MKRFVCLALVICLQISFAWAGPSTPEWKFNDAERIVAFADVHGAYDELVDLLQTVDVLDEDLNWIGGNTYLVSTGDLVDRGPRSRDVMDLIMRLEDEAEAAGGKVIMVLGNHEVMNITGDVRYVSEAEYAAFASEETKKERQKAFREYRRKINKDMTKAAFAEKFPPGYFAHRRAFSPAGDYGSWLIRKPAVVVVNQIAFVHGGLPEMVADLGPIEINKATNAALREYFSVRSKAIDAGVISQYLQLKEEKAVLGKLLETNRLEGDDSRLAQKLLKQHSSLLFVSEGPFWYRGTAKNEEKAELPVLSKALLRLGAQSAVVGHTPSKGDVQTRFNGRVTLLDTGMLASHYHGRPAALVIDKSGREIVYADSAAALEPAGAHGGVLDSDAAYEAFLLEAEVVKVENLGEGITKPRRVTLEKDGQTLRAVFKDVNIEKSGATRMARGRPVMGFSDKYVYEVAAYKLDRMLGLNMVPPTVIRKIKGKKGSLQLWVEDAMGEKQRRADKLEAPDQGRFFADRELMSAFDALILNMDRNMSNMLYTEDWKLHMIDHSRAFALQVERPAHLKDKEIPMTEAFREKLMALDQDSLVTAMKGLLSKGQVKSMLKRRDALLGIGKKKKKR